MKQIQLEKWRVYLLAFIGLWSIGLLGDLLGRLPWNSDTRSAVLHNLLFATVITSIIYFARKDDK
jgi:hypothetical protein